MKKYKVLIVALSLLVLPVAGNCETDGWTGNFSVLLGQKYFEKDDWKPLEDQTVIGFMFDFRPKQWPVNIAIDYLSADKYELQSIPPGTVTRVEGGTSDINIGIRKKIEITPTIRPYIGGGLAYIVGDFNNGVTSDDDAGTGFWIDAGIAWTFSKPFTLGIDARYSKAEITLFGKDLEAGGFYGGLTAGFSW